MKKTIKREMFIKLKVIISRIVLFFLYRGFKVTVKKDNTVKKEIENMLKELNKLSGLPIKLSEAGVQQEDSKIGQQMRADTITNFNE